MPRRRNYHRRRPRRNYRKKRSQFLRTKGSGLSPSFPIGKTFKFKTRYCETAVNLNPGVGGTPSTQVYSMNGLYDPNITGVGHQPIGFDQVMPLYDHYTVIGSRAKVVASNFSAIAATKLILRLKDNVTTSTNISEVLENGMSRWTTLPPSGTGGSTRTLSINCNPSRFFGQPVLKEDKYQGNVGSNPADQVYLHVINAPETSLDLDEVKFTIIIEYIAIFTEPKQLAQS